VIEYTTPSYLTATENVIRVGMSGSVGVDYYSVKDAVDSITDATSTNTYVVHVAAGLYKENPITMKSYVAVVGMNSTSTIIEATSASLTLINGADQSMIQDVQLQGCTGSNAAAVEYKSATTPQTNAIFYVENVRFGPNYTNARTVGTGGGNCIMQCSNVKYGGYNFTTGFHVTNDGTGIGRMQLRNVTSTNGGVVTTSGLVFGLADKPGCTFIVNGCLLTKAVGAAAGTGFLAYNGASLRLTAVNFQRWDKAIYMPQSGSAPSIFGSALNFENDTLDIVVEHSGSTGKIDGSDTFLKTQINFSSSLYLVNKDARVITVAKKGGDFSSIKSAVDYITDSAENNRYVVSVGPGQFFENEIDLVGKPYVSIVGSNIQTTEIYPSGSNQNLINIGINNEISFLSLAEAPLGYAAIVCDDIGDFAQAHKISFYNCDTNIKIVARTQDTQFYGEYIDFNGTYSYGAVVSGSNGFYALANLENYYQFPSGSPNLIANSAEGTARLDLRSALFQGEDESNSVCLQLSDGANTEGTALDVQNWGTGFKVLNSGTSASFNIVGSMIHDSVNYDFDILHPTANCRFQGTADHSKINNASNDFFWNFLDETDGELDITRKISVTFEDGTHTDASTLIFKGSPMGVMDGGIITTASGLSVDTALGFGYIEDQTNPDVYKRYDWNNTNLVLPATSSNYVYINNAGTLSYDATEPDPVQNIVLGRVITDNTGIEFIDQTPYQGLHAATDLTMFARHALGPVYSVGSIVTATSSFRLNVTEGTYHFGDSMFMPAGTSSLSFIQYYRSGSDWNRTLTNTVVTDVWDSGSNVLVPLSSSAYTKHTLYVGGEGVNEKYFLVIGQTQYDTLVEAEGAALPAPPSYFTDGIVNIASIIVQSGSATIDEIRDIRPVVGFKASGISATATHGNLLGLEADDHQQYLLVNGTRGLTGNLSFGGNNITNVGTINATSITASLQGTSSWSERSITASYTQNAETANNATSASFATTSSFTISSSFATTASYALNTPNTGRQITSYVPFIATAGQTVTLTRIVAAVTEIGTEMRIKTDLTYVASCSLSVRVEQASILNGPQIRVQYSTDEVTWNYLTANATNYPTVALNTAGTTATTKEAIVAGAKALVTLRIITVGGDGTNNSTARVGNVTLGTIYNL